MTGSYQPLQLVIDLLVGMVEEGKAALGSPLQNHPPPSWIILVHLCGVSKCPSFAGIPHSYLIGI